MAHVLVEFTRRPGRQKRVPARRARTLLRLGLARLIEEPEPAPEPEPVEARDDASEFDALSYHELRSLVRERDIEPEGYRRDQLIDALEGRYLRRDMQAED